MPTKRLTALVEQADHAARFANFLDHTDTEALRDCLLALAETQRDIVAYLEFDEAAYELHRPNKEKR